MPHPPALARFLKAPTIVLGLLTSIPVQAFVSHANSSGQFRQWPPPNSPVHPISTNAWNPVTGAIRYHLARDAYSATNSAAELNAVRVSFDQWQSVPGTRLRFEEAEPIEKVPDVNTTDGTNTVFWAKRSTLINGGLDDISGVLAVTSRRVTPENVILEADITFNGVEFQWFTDFAASEKQSHFVEATALHEIGHLIGLDHSPVGGATMFARGHPGVNVQTGLSSDEVAAARALYPAPDWASRMAALRGRVLQPNATPMLGVIVVAEDERGNVASGTLTDGDGRFLLPALPPGVFRLRASPLDPPGSRALLRLVSSGDFAADLAQAETRFVPITTEPITTTAGESRTLDLSIALSAPAFRITQIRQASEREELGTGLDSPTQLPLGAKNYVVGVYSPEFTADGLRLEITGDGLRLGETEFIPNALSQGTTRLHLVQARATVAPNATPGLRSFSVWRGTNAAFALGFL